MRFVFEVSWEVCNKVGGIHTVITSKSAEAVREYGDNYYLLGPLLDHNTDFEETGDPALEPVRRALTEKGLRCRVGRWQIESRPRVILVDFRDRYDTSKLLYDYWQRFGVDSHLGGFDYIEPIVFSTACGEAIEALFHAIVSENDSAVAHCHEWMCGGALLHLKKRLPEIGTVFTTHATILGRSAAGAGVDIHHRDGMNPEEDAATYGVAAKHSMEAACAREADCFTTVSLVTADEAAAILGRRPDHVVYNGLNLDRFPDHIAAPELSRRNRAFLLDVARRFLQKPLPESTRFWIISGRYEFHNKGFDVFLQSLGRLDQTWRSAPDRPPVVAWFMVAAGHKGVPEDVRRRLAGETPHDGMQVGIATHRLYDEQNDPIVKSCYRLGLRNAPENPVNVIFSPAYIDGHDGIFNLRYEDMLAACDLGVFPSFYEPWGYTPLEAAACAVPTITTDLAGFGAWVKSLEEDAGRGVSIVARRGRSDDDVVRDLTALLAEHADMPAEQQAEARRKARLVAELSDWRSFFRGYTAAYEDAAEKAAQRVDTQDTSAASGRLFSTFKGPRDAMPRYRSFTVATALPRALERLGEMARNLWWTWHPEAESLFAEIEPALWEEGHHNPVRLLGRVPAETLREKAGDQTFVERYERTLAAFDAYMADRACRVGGCDAIDADRPVAYFSMEFCLHESLPIYSGGLGVLAGDHLKSASDLGIPLVGMGLLYKQGYFEQRIDAQGNQVERYPLLDCSELPLETVLDADGGEARVSVTLPGRTLSARVWQVNVGRVRLYLLDSDVEENTPEDRRITWRLYGGDMETRLKQEMLLGLGGVRFLRDRLRVMPAVYHLNEGHCGFLLIERARRFIARGLSFQEAREAVKASTVFTTHTPVPAGNEAFEPHLIAYFFKDTISDLGITMEQLMELGRDRPADEKAPFSMTVLALKLSSRANAVSRLHGRVCREMWRDVWKGVAVEEVPISSVTNGIHLASWIHPGMRRLLSRHAEIPWDGDHDDAAAWERVADIPPEELWHQHEAQKREMIEEIKKRVLRDCIRRGEEPEIIRDTIARLEPETLTVGFARRFASYKRGHLMFRDREALLEILTHPERPIRLVFAGKAHPADKIGKDIIRNIVETGRLPDFRGRVVYLEDYDMALGRLLTSGVDVWLNTPVRPFEASGTSGMKVAPNGGLNCSILDGWWDEAYRPGLGWAIDPGGQYSNREHQDEMDRQALFDLLSKRIAPLYYDRGDRPFPAGWVEMMKESIRSISPRFNTTRMLKEYWTESYHPTAIRGQRLFTSDFKGLRELTAWKRRISARFSTVRIEKAIIEGLRGDILPSGGELVIEVLVDPGRLDEREIEAELVIGPRDGETFSGTPSVVRFQRVGKLSSGLLRFRLSHRVEQGGNYLYAVRVVPVHDLLACTQETGLVCWG